MRVTQNITSQNSLYYLQKTRTRMDLLEQKTASGQNVNRPSDDPVTTRLLLGLADQINASEQYKSNISKADTWYNIANSAFTAMGSMLTDVRSRLASATNTFSSQNDRDQMVSYLKLAKKTLVDLANTDIGGVHVFGGTNNLIPPFKERKGDLAVGATTIPNIDITNLAAGMELSGVGIDKGTRITNVVAGPPPSIEIDKPLVTTTNMNAASINVYFGNSDDISTEINKGGVKEALNISGNQFLMAGSGSGPYGSIDILETIDQLVYDLENNQLTNISNRIKAIDEGNAQINSAQTELQSRMVRLNAAKNMHESTINTMKSLISSKQTADYAELAVSLNQQKIAFEATLSSTAKIMQISLLDYL